MQSQNSLYLCKVADDCSRYSLASSLNSSPSTLASIITINKAISSTGSIPKVLKSDRGTYFMSQPFASYLNEHNIFHLKSFPRYPRCNAKIERIFRGVSTNVRTYISPSNSIVDILNAILQEDFLHNYIRPHHSLGGKTPADVYWSRSPPDKKPHKLVPVSHYFKGSKCKLDVRVFI